MARFQILKGSTSTWSIFRNQLVYFRTTCFYNPMKYCILLSFYINIIFLNVFQTSPFCPYRVPDIPTWSYQTRVFHLLITSWHILPVHYFTLAPFFAFSLIRLSYINKSFLTRMSYLLPRAKFQRVTFFMKRSYLPPRDNFKLPYLPNPAHWDPGICSQLRSSHIHSIHQKSKKLPSSVVPPWSHYLNQCRNIINWSLRNKLQWNLNRNCNIFIQENVFESVVCEMSSILSRPQSADWVVIIYPCNWKKGHQWVNGWNKVTMRYDVDVYKYIRFILCA